MPRTLGKPAGETDQLVYIQVTRGVAMRDHVMPPGIAAHRVRHQQPHQSASRAEQRAQRRGLRHAPTTSAGRRRTSRASAWLGAVLARQISADAGAAETVMFRDGFLSEGAAANVWVVQGRHGARPAQGQPGAGRHPLRPDRGAVRAKPASRSSCAASRATRCSPPTNCCCPPPPRKCCRSPRWTARPVGNGQPGPIYEKLYAGYQRAKRSTTMPT